MIYKLFGITLLFKIFLLAVGSWLLIHILAVFGIFIALAYPIWWFFFPQQTACLICRTKKK